MEFPMYTTLRDPHPIRYMRVSTVLSLHFGHAPTGVASVFCIYIRHFYFSLAFVCHCPKPTIMLGSILSSGLLIDQKLSSQTS